MFNFDYQGLEPRISRIEGKMFRMEGVYERLKEFFTDLSELLQSRFTKVDLTLNNLKIDSECEYSTILNQFAIHRDRHDTRFNRLDTTLAAMDKKMDDTIGLRQEMFLFHQELVEIKQQQTRTNDLLLQIASKLGV